MPNLLALDSVLTFGKHQGAQLEDLIEDEPSYISWLFENNVVEFDTDVIRVLESKKLI